MNCNRMVCRCDCGGFAQPVALWITDQKALLVTCFCVACESQLSVIFPLAELYKDCPLPNFDEKKLIQAVDSEIAKIKEEAGKPIRPPLTTRLSDNDKKWCAEIHINPEDGLLQ